MATIITIPDDYKLYIANVHGEPKYRAIAAGGEPQAEEMLRFQLIEEGYGKVRVEEMLVDVTIGEVDLALCDYAHRRAGTDWP